MGLFKSAAEKLKDIFSEEVEELPIKKEMTKVEISTPVDEKEIFVDGSTIRTEEKAKEPIYFDDKDFDTLTPVKEKSKFSYGFKETKKEEVKIFHPSPIISPVYGILDKNYHKEDIKSRNSVEKEYVSTSISIDDVRKKAFGTLEDDIETDLLNTHPVEIKETKNEVENDLFDDLDFNLDGVLDNEPRHAKVEDEIAYVVEIPKTEDIMNDLKEETLEEPVKEESKDDLFDLIDSMYDKGN